MKTKLIAIGNSRGVRIPAALIRQAGLTDQLDLTVTDGGILLRASPVDPRAGWAEAIAAATEEDLAPLEDWDFPNSFDDEEWTWDED